LKEKKKEKERKEELEKNRRPPPTSPRENTSFEQNKTAASWRTNKAGPAPAPVRKEEKPKKQYIKDEEGFISKGHRGWETRDKPQETQNPPKQTSTATKKTEPNIDSNNIYASLVDD